jgi:hypothetical protein
MIHKGTTREAKCLRTTHRSSTPSQKLRRHRNKARIWRRCVKRLSQIIEVTPPTLVEGVLLDTSAPVIVTAAFN